MNYDWSNREMFFEVAFELVLKDEYNFVKREKSQVFSINRGIQVRPVWA
jgi:hypothetical protein